MVQIQELQDKANSLNDAKEFCDPETASSSGSIHVSSQPMTIPSPSGMIRRDSCLQPHARNSLGTSGHVFEGPPARAEPSSALFQNSKNLASSSRRLRPIDTGKVMQQGGGVRRRAAGFYTTNSFNPVVKMSTCCQIDGMVDLIFDPMHICLFDF